MQVAEACVSHHALKSLSELSLLPDSHELSVLMEPD